MRSSVKAYVFGIAALGAAVLLRWLLDPLMGDAFPLVTLYGAVVPQCGWAAIVRPS